MRAQTDWVTGPSSSSKYMAEIKCEPWLSDSWVTVLMVVLQLNWKRYTLSSDYLGSSNWAIYFLAFSLTPLENTQYVIQNQIKIILWSILIDQSQKMNSYILERISVSKVKTYSVTQNIAFTKHAGCLRFCFTINYN